MKFECITCGRESDNRKEFYELSGVAGLRMLCKTCAAELGIKNFLTAGFHSNTKVLKKYVMLHPEAQSRLDSQLNKIEQYKKEIKAGYANITQNYSKMSLEELQQALKNYVIYNSGLNLLPSEVCYLSAECASIKYKDVVVGSIRTSSHIGGNKKGLYAGSSSSMQMNNRQIVAEKYPGRFYFTNLRMVCNAVKLSFEIPLNEITTMTCYEDGVTIMANGKSFNVAFKDVKRLKTVINISNEYEKKKPQKTLEQPVSSTAQNLPQKDIPELLRKYKALHDEGIISAKEFEEKKQQLLSTKDI